MDLSKFGIDWDHSDQLNERSQKLQQFSANKEVVLSTLLNLYFNWRNEDIDVDSSKVNLPQLFKKYFSKLIEKEYTSYDLSVLKELHPELKNFLLVAKEPKVSNGSYLIGKEKLSCIVTHDGDAKKVLIGASAANKAIWYYFQNDKEDVNNGIVYVRRSSISKLEKLSTFEINPFIRGNTIVTNPVTGEAENKHTITCNPNWLVSTLDNMEKHVFQILK